MTRGARPTDVVKEELGLSNAQYEVTYTAFATKMKEEGLIGAQMRSIQSKATARCIGAEVRRNHHQVLGRVAGWQMQRLTRMSNALRNASTATYAE